MDSESLAARPYYIGLMTGTSLDAMDAVLVDFSRQPPRILARIAPPLPEPTRQRIAMLCQGGADELDRLGQLDRELALLFADAVDQLLRQAGMQATEVAAIGCHGQTLRHRPQAHHPFTLQVGDPATLALETGITTVAHFRQADIAAGGQGAPLVPAFHQAMLRRRDEYRVVLNIGGIANITILPAGEHTPSSGFDTGPGNLLLDAWIARQRQQGFDANGRWARSGRVQADLLRAMLHDPYFHKTPPKSTGREHFNLAWLERLLEDFPGLEAVDVQATLTELSARTMAQAIEQYAPGCERLLVCGGGVHNAFLLQRLRHHLPDLCVESTAAHGVDPDFMEAMAFAWLARQRLLGQPGNLPAVTGARCPVVLGGVYQPLSDSG